MGLKTKTNMIIGKRVLGILAGLALGAIAAILFAPAKGSKTRKQIINKGNDFVDELKSKFDEFRDLITEKLKSTENDAEELVDKGKAKYDDAKKDVKNAAAHFKHNGAADINHATS